VSDWLDTLAWVLVIGGFTLGFFLYLEGMRRMMRGDIYRGNNNINDGTERRAEV
jgi:hypothetical protein